jgi:hypothetical protein
MDYKLKILKPNILRDDSWNETQTDIPCDTFITAMSGFIDTQNKVIHLDLPNNRKAVILCIEKNTLVAVCDKAQTISDKDFAAIFDEVFYSEDEIPSRQKFIEMLRKVTFEGDPVTLEYIS